MRPLWGNEVKMFLDEEINFVKSQINHHTRSIEFHRSRGDGDKERRHTGILRRFNDILPKMVQANSALSLGQAVIPVDEKKVGNRLGNIMDLPEEIRSQLVSVQFDEIENQILKVVKESFGGVATIDEIFVGMYRETREVMQRDALANKIYRMTRKEMLFSVEGRKGVYSMSKSQATNKKEHESE